MLLGAVGFAFREPLAAPRPARPNFPLPSSFLTTVCVPFLALAMVALGYGAEIEHGVAST